MDIQKERSQLNAKVKELQTRQERLEAKIKEIQNSDPDLRNHLDKLLAHQEANDGLVKGLENELSACLSVDKALKAKLEELNSYEKLAQQDRQKGRLRKRFQRLLTKVEESDNPFDEIDHLQALTEVEQERREI